MFGKVRGKVSFRTWATAWMWVGNLWLPKWKWHHRWTRRDQKGSGRTCIHRQEHSMGFCKPFTTNNEEYWRSLSEREHSGNLGMGKNGRENRVMSLFAHQALNILTIYFQALELITSQLAIREDIKTTCCATKILNTLAMLMFSSGSQSYNKVLISNKW